MQEREIAIERLSNFLKERREQYGWKTENLARKGGIDKSYLSRIERGKAAGRTTVPPKETLEKVAAAYQVSLEDLENVIAGGQKVSLPPVRSAEQLIEELRMVQPIAIPVVEHPAHAGHQGSPVIDYVYWDRARAVNRNLVCIPIKGNCMEPRIREGDRIIVDRDAWPEQGDIVVAIVDEQVYVRRFYQRDSEIVLRADNREYPDIVAREVDIVGKMIQGTYGP